MLINGPDPIHQKMSNFVNRPDPTRPVDGRRPMSTRAFMYAFCPSCPTMLLHSALKCKTFRAVQTMLTHLKTDTIGFGYTKNSFMTTEVH